MALLLSILIALSLNAMVNANKVTFTKVDGRVYLETDNKHYAMFGQVTDADGVRIVVVNDDFQYQQTSKCLTERSDLNEVKPDHLKAYSEIRTNYLKDSRDRRRNHALRGGSKYWSAEILDDQEYSASKIDTDIIAYSSKFFPTRLALVIIDGDVIMFIHKNGHITMKTINCLFSNEKTLVTGIEKIKTGDHLIPRMTPIGEESLGNYLKKHPIDEEQFYTEQEYVEPGKPARRSWTKLLLPSRFYRSISV